VQYGRCCVPSDTTSEDGGGDNGGEGGGERGGGGGEGGGSGSRVSDVSSQQRVTRLHVQPPAQPSFCACDVDVRLHGPVP
jgi:hypothetical protein